MPSHRGCAVTSSRRIFAGASLQQVEEDIAWFEDTGIVREQAEHNPHQEPLQVVTPVARFVKRVMQPPDQFGRLDVRRVLVAERPALHPEDEAERLDIARQFRERERDGLPFVKIVQLEGLEVAYQNVAGMVTLEQREQIVDRLAIGFLEVAPGALLLDDQHTRPEQVDESRTIVQLRDMRLVARDGAPTNTEHLEELVIEALRLALLVRGVSPLFGEGGGADADLVP